MRILLSICAILLGLTLGCGQPSSPSQSYLSAPVIEVFQAEPSGIQAGNSTTLQWRVQGAKKVSIDQGVGNVVTAGSCTVSPSSNIVYTLTAENDYGNATATVQVVVETAAGSQQGGSTPVSLLPLVKVFTAQPSIVMPDQSARLIWEVQNADDVKIEPNIGHVIHSGSQLISPVLNATYKLTASNRYGSIEAATMVTVSDEEITMDSPAIQYFTASRYVINQGESALLSWSTINGASVVLNQHLGIVSATGTKEVSPSETTTYILTVTSPDGSQFQAVTINVK